MSPFVIFVQMMMFIIMHLTKFFKNSPKSFYMYLVILTKYKNCVIIIWSMCIYTLRGEVTLMKNSDEYVKLQKIKLLKLWEILNRKTDKEHPLTPFQLIDELTDLGIKAERRTIYTDINTMIA